MPNTPILFVSHDASYTGAPVLLLHLLRWMLANTSFAIRVALGKGGPLVPQFVDLAPTTVFDASTSGSAPRFAGRLSRRIRAALDKRRLQRAIGADRFALIYANTIANADVLKSLSDQDCPLISHIHELSYAIDAVATPADLAYTFQRTSRFIAASEAVEQNLVNRHRIDRHRIDIVYECIPAATIDRAALRQSTARVRAELGIPERSRIVGGAGTVDWRKGHDLFIQLARSVILARPQDDVHFVWIGGAADPDVTRRISHDLGKLGLERRVHFPGHQIDFASYLAAYDIFCLTSREDPFPLVVLEAAALGKPVICFEASGGSPEFVRHDCGYVVPYLDVPAMAARVCELLDDDALRRRLGASGESRVGHHHDVSVIGPRILEIIERTIREANRSQ